MAVPNAKVKKLQQALASYATITGFAAANPGVADGIVGTRTINAVIAMIPLLPKMPSEIKALATIGPLIMINADARTKAAKFITDNADKITNGIIGLAAYQAGTGKLPTQTPTTPVVPTQVPTGPTAPTSPSGGASIFFFDRSRGIYRIAIRTPGLSGGDLGAAYTEVAPSTARPAGVEVTRTDFYTATGRWYATWWGIASLVGGGLAVTGLGVVVAKRVAG